MGRTIVFNMVTQTRFIAPVHRKQSNKEHIHFHIFTRSGRLGLSWSGKQFDGPCVLQGRGNAERRARRTTGSCDGDEW